MSLIATCSVVIQKSLPAKMKDPGALPFPALLGNMNSRKLCVTQVPTST